MEEIAGEREATQKRRQKLDAYKGVTTPAQAFAWDSGGWTYFPRP